MVYGIVAYLISAHVFYAASGSFNASTAFAARLATFTAVYTTFLSAATISDTFRSTIADLGFAVAFAFACAYIITVFSTNLTNTTFFAYFVTLVFAAAYAAAMPTIIGGISGSIDLGEYPVNVVYWKAFLVYLLEAIAIFTFVYFYHISVE